MDYLRFGNFFMIEENRDSIFCLRVFASSFLNSNVKSNSNSLCLNPNPENSSQKKTNQNARFFSHY